MLKVTPSIDSYAVPPLLWRVSVSRVLVIVSTILRLLISSLSTVVQITRRELFSSVTWLSADPSTNLIGVFETRAEVAHCRGASGPSTLVDKVGQRLSQFVFWFLWSMPINTTEAHVSRVPLYKAQQTYQRRGKDRARDCIPHYKGHDKVLPLGMCQ